MNRLCACGSGETKYELKDGYGIFMTYACDRCVKSKRAEFRSDISEQYETDEAIDAE